MDADEVNSQQDFQRFLTELRQDLLTNPEDWKNHTLPAFLDAMHRRVDDTEGYCRNTKTRNAPANQLASVCQHSAGGQYLRVKRQRLIIKRPRPR